MSKVKNIKVTVDRKKWYRGQSHEYSKLLLDNGKMCCIGFLARELGCKPKETRNQATLALVDSAHEFHDTYDDILASAYEVNDNPDITDDQREKELTRLGKKMHVLFSFTN